MTNSKTVQSIIKSYGIAFTGCLFLTSINAVFDYNSSYNSDSLGDIFKFHFLSALGYAIPVSALVFIVIRNQSRQVRVQKALQIVTYLVLTIAGGFLGSLVVAKVIFDADEPGTGDLDMILPWSLGIIVGAILLPTAYFLYRRKNKRTS
jgi:hypothetical protein